EAAHESPLVMLVPLGVLAAGSIAAGLPAYRYFAGHEAGEFFRESVKMAPGILDAMHHISETSPIIAQLPTVMMLIGFLVAYQFYIRRPDMPVALARSQPLLYDFLLNKWYFDEIYDLLLVNPTKRLGRLLWKGGDERVIDGF